MYAELMKAQEKHQWINHVMQFCYAHIDSVVYGISKKCHRMK